jgi:hypothetical protein
MFGGVICVAASRNGATNAGTLLYKACRGMFLSELAVSRAVELRVVLHRTMPVVCTSAAIPKYLLLLLLLCSILK